MQLVNYVILLTEIAFIHKRLPRPSLFPVSLPFFLILSLSVCLLVSTLHPAQFHPVTPLSGSRPIWMAGASFLLTQDAVLTCSFEFKSVEMPELPPYLDH